jgi:Secretion system C-terminal sorting domain
MKKILLLSAILVSSFGVSQIAVSRHSGAQIADGQVVAFNTIAFPAAEMDFYVTNTSTTATASVKINCLSLVNNDGTGFELCFGNECLSAVEEGESYPTAPVVLAPGGVNGNFDHFLNTNAGSGVFPKDYVFRFYQVGNPNGNTVTLTYRYDPSLTVNEIDELQTSGVILKSTFVDNQLDLDVLKETNLAIFDLNGKVISSTSLKYGIQSIDVSDLSSGVYILNFTSNEGVITNKKFIKK